METLKKSEMEELIGQFVDVVEDFLEKELTKESGESTFAIIKGARYDRLAAEFRGILTGWKLVEEKVYPDSADEAEMEEWNTPTD